jgi:hypothetical protein
MQEQRSLIVKCGPSFLLPYLNNLYIAFPLAFSLCIFAAGYDVTIL